MQNAPQPFSNKQIDKLGERLKMPGLPRETDLAMLSAYRDTFAKVAKEVCDMVVKIADIEPTARATKSTKSIVEKLRRDGVKLLSSMQDIAGCRVTVSDPTTQNILVSKLREAFPNSKIYDRVQKPSNGYRAQHVVVKHLGKRIEIQIRTHGQHAWALMSEAIADIYGQEIKYGLGSSDWVSFLNEASDTIHKEEMLGHKYDLNLMIQSIQDFKLSRLAVNEPELELLLLEYKK